MRFVVSLLILVAAPASAAWELSGASSNATFYSDPETIRRTGNFVKIWQLADYNVAKKSGDGRSYSSSKNLYEYDCAEMRVRILSYIDYSGPMGNGTSVGSGEMNGSWSSVAPGTVGERTFRFACGGASTGSPTSPAPSSNADFDLVNRSPEDILFVYVSPVGTTSWGADKLGENVVISPGNRFKISMPQDGQCRYDVQVGYKDRRFEERRGQNLCALNEIAFDGSTQRVLPAVTAPRASSPPSAAPASGGKSFGTGFFVSSQGHALTNNHVTEKCRSIVALHEGRELPAQLVRRDERNDLALIRVQTNGAVPFASFRAVPAIKAGEGVIVAGFPLPNILQTGLNITLGNVSALAGLGGNTAFLQVTAPVQPGNSGGPLLDMGGNLVGVVVSKLDAARVAQVTGDIPQNVNFAVQGAVARLFLEAGGQRVEERSSAKEMRVGDVSDRARAFTFQIECRQ